MEMIKINYFVGIFLVSFLMFSLVAGAGYNVVVPSSSTSSTSSSSSGGGGSVTTATTNTTTNETVSGGEDEAGDEDEGIGDAISDGVDSVKNFIKNINLKWILVLIGALGIVGASVWYFLKDKRKNYVEVKVKKKN